MTILGVSDRGDSVPRGSIVVPFFGGLPYRILNINHKKELVWSLWVVVLARLNPASLFERLVGLVRRLKVFMLHLCACVTVQKNSPNALLIYIYTYIHIYIYIYIYIIYTYIYIHTYIYIYIYISK